MDVLHPQLRTHRHADASWPVLVWTAAERVRAIASAPFGVGFVTFVPRPLSDAALVNAVATATEAKVQALSDGAVATGTATDALCIASPPGGRVAPFGGPRSTWDGAVAATGTATDAEGIRRWLPA